MGYFILSDLKYFMSLFIQFDLLKVARIGPYGRATQPCAPRCFHSGNAAEVLVYARQHTNRLTSGPICFGRAPWVVIGVIQSDQ